MQLLSKAYKYAWTDIFVLGVFFLFLLTSSCKLSSPDNRLEAFIVGSGGNKHYQIVEKETRRVVLTTRAQYTTPNDVKTGIFSKDSKKFAAAYHYGYGSTGQNSSQYTWVGVWSTENGNFLSEKVIPEWTIIPAKILDE